MPNVLVIGYGSELRGDDRLGPLAARQLSQRLAMSGLRILDRPSLTPELAAELAEVDLAIFIDCSQHGPVGQVVERAIDSPDQRHMGLVHFLDPAALLGWTNLLYGRSPQAVLFTVAGCSFECGDELSPPMRAALPELLDRATRLIEASQERGAP